VKSFLKKYVLKYSEVIAAVALLVTTATVNSTCYFLTHQEELPKNANKLRKF
jgi:cyclic lactone autoinducer peptide